MWAGVRCDALVAAGREIARGERARAAVKPWLRWR
ncbi:hypothetical protein [Streptomyces sp. NPDC029704]